MKKTIFGGLAVGMIALSGFTGKEDAYKADTRASSLEWTGAKLTGEHTGSIRFSSGTLTVENETVTKGWFEVDMTSIEDKDIQDPEWKLKLENHLKSEDFFDAAKYPKARFETISIQPLENVKEGGFTHHVKGNLTIKDKTNPIEFDAVIKLKDGKLACVGTATVDRSKFDVKYGSKTFFAGIGDKVIYDEFKLKFNVIAVKNPINE